MQQVQLVNLNLATAIDGLISGIAGNTNKIVGAVGNKHQQDVSNKVTGGIQAATTIADKFDKLFGPHQLQNLNFAVCNGSATEPSFCKYQGGGNQGSGSNGNNQGNGGNQHCSGWSCDKSLQELNLATSIDGLISGIAGDANKIVGAVGNKHQQDVSNKVTGGIQAGTSIADKLDKLFEPQQLQNLNFSACNGSATEPSFCKFMGGGNQHLQELNLFKDITGLVNGVAGSSNKIVGDAGNKHQQAVSNKVTVGIKAGVSFANKIDSIFQQQQLQELNLFKDITGLVSGVAGSSNKIVGDAGNKHQQAVSNKVTVGIKAGVSIANKIDDIFQHQVIILI